MITAGVVIARDPELGINSGIYRFIVKEKNLTGIDIVTPNNMRLFAQRAFERKEPLPISISHRHASDRDHGLGLSRAAGRRRDGDRRRHSRRAGGARAVPDHRHALHRRRRDRARSRDPADRLDLPEGRFGEFTRLMGGLHWNPLVRIKAISMRKDAIYYNLHMPWENTWLAAPTRYAAIRTGAEDRGRAGQGHQRHARRLRLLARRDLDQEAAGRGQERAAGGALGDGPQARRRGRRRHRRQRSDATSSGRSRRACRATRT